MSRTMPYLQGLPLRCVVGGANQQLRGGRQSRLVRLQHGDLVSRRRWTCLAVRGAQRNENGHTHTRTHTTSPTQMSANADSRGQLSPIGNALRTCSRSTARACAAATTKSALRWCATKRLGTSRASAVQAAATSGHGRNSSGPATCPSTLRRGSAEPAFGSWLTDGEEIGAEARGCKCESKACPSGDASKTDPYDTAWWVATPQAGAWNSGPSSVHKPAMQDRNGATYRATAGPKPYNMVTTASPNIWYPETHRKE